MSDVSQGEGWWEAADGKWYPPTETPGSQEAAPDPAAAAAATRYCTNCAAPVSPAAAACMSCGFAPAASRNFCGGCGSAITPGQAVCTNCGEAVGSRVYSGGTGQQGQKSKIAAGILGILLGAFGAHKFYLGYTNAALIMLGGTLVGYCGGIFLSFLIFPIVLLLLPFAASVIGIIEGIIYLTKTDQQFYEEYELNTKEWF